MDERTDIIRREIEATRASMTTKLELIEQRVQGTVEEVRETVTLRGMVNKRPLEAFGAAVLVGLGLGLLRGRTS